MAKIKQIICISLVLLTFSVNAQNIVLGAERTDAYLPLLKNKKVGIIGNQTSMIGNTHLVDSLLSLGVNIVKVFSPEHGFRGKADAGDKIEDGIDEKTGLTIISLYGKNKKPYPEQLEGIDVILFDIQDVGARFYTYISTLHYIMEAAGENNIKVIVLDRPNPNGHYVDGPIREESFESFVGMHPIPIVHGMTIGEYAKMINGENWISENCNLTIIKMENYRRDMAYDLPVKPSPNLPNARSVNLYPSLCLFEGTTVSTKYGPIKTDHILFIGSGAFQLAKPSDLLPELQGRLPIRVELEALTSDDFKRILKEPDYSLIKQYVALLKTENVELEFSDDGIDAIANMASEVNNTVENIGARRLHTIIERILDDISFTATDRAGEKIIIDSEYVKQNLDELVKDTDLSKFIL